MLLTKSLMRQSHFLGVKIRNLRKRNHLTMEDLSVRCIRNNPEYAPSVSYLSMIERGKRVPSVEMLEVIAAVFQKQPSWFLDDQPDDADITPNKGSKGGIKGIPLEPSFLFSNDILQIAIPEMLSQTGISGRQFAHLLIRAHQENNNNHFPDLERAAEDVGKKQMPLQVAELIAITTQLGLQIKWFTRPPNEVISELGNNNKALVTSFLDVPDTIYLNMLLKKNISRLKYDLAVHIGHCVLHNREGLKRILVAGTAHGHETEPYGIMSNHSHTVNAQDMLHAWRDFESSFFAGALLCPKLPFRQLLDRSGYEIDVHKGLDVSPAVAMRRMTSVSAYPHWHYFDAYAPGKLKAVYRGNGIPLPWGNMRSINDPCQHWAVFRMINQSPKGSSAQLSILDVDGQPRLYSCESTKVKDMAGNPHVLCAGVDLNPALESDSINATELAHELKKISVKRGGSAPIPRVIKQELTRVAKLLNINWIERGLENDARVICTRGTQCPRQPNCYKEDGGLSPIPGVEQIQASIKQQSTS